MVFPQVVAYQYAAASLALSFCLIYFGHIQQGPTLGGFIILLDAGLYIYFTLSSRDVLITDDAFQKAAMANKANRIGPIIGFGAMAIVTLLVAMIAFMDQGIQVITGLTLTMCVLTYLTVMYNAMRVVQKLEE